MKPRPSLPAASRQKLLQLIPHRQLLATGEQSIQPFIIDSDGYVMAVVNLQVAKANGNMSDPIQFEFDSGADICCMDTATATGLGLNPTSGQQLEMSGVDGKPLICYLQTLTCTMPGVASPFQFPFCVGPVDCLLFGRQGVWNQFSSILFDQVNKQTVFTL